MDTYTSQTSTGTRPNKDGDPMKYNNYTFTFKGGKITVRAANYMHAEILAKAEAIERGWDHTIL